MNKAKALLYLAENRYKARDITALAALNRAVKIEPSLDTKTKELRQKITKSTRFFNFVD